MNGSTIGSPLQMHLVTINEVNNVHKPLWSCCMIRLTILGKALLLTIGAICLVRVVPGQDFATLRSQLDQITKRGNDLAAYDSAVSLGTDAVMALHPPDDELGNYVARLSASGWIVDFGQLNETNNTFLTSYEAIKSTMSTHYTAMHLSPARVDKGWNLLAAKAISISLKNFKEEARPYNVAVLPAYMGGIYVYIYPARTSSDVYPLGDDVRFTFASSGSLVETRVLHKGIIDYKTSEHGQTMTAGYHSHIQSGLPEDTDILLVKMRTPQVPEIVVTKSHLFTIGLDGHINIGKPPR